MRGHNGLRVRRWALLAVAISAQLGCAEMLRDTAKKTAPAVVAGTVEGLADPKTQQKLVDAIDEAHVVTASARLSAGILDGILASLEDPKRRARVEAIVSGAIAKTTATATDTFLARLLDDKVQQKLRGAAGGLVASLVTSIRDAAGSPDGKSVFGAAAHQIAKQATLGFQAALDETRRARASGEMRKAEGALVIAANTASKTGRRFLWTLGIGLFAVAAGLCFTLIWAVRKSRARRAELAGRDAALLMLTSAIKDGVAQPDRFEAALRQAMRDKAGSEHVRKILREHGHLADLDVAA